MSRREGVSAWPKTARRKLSACCQLCGQSSRLIIPPPLNRRSNMSQHCAPALLSRESGDLAPRPNNTPQSATASAPEQHTAAVTWSYNHTGLTSAHWATPQRWLYRCRTQPVPPTTTTHNQTVHVTGQLLRREQQATLGPRAAPASLAAAVLHAALAA